MVMASVLPGYYTIREAVPIIGRSHGMICRYIRDGLIPAKRIGVQILIEQSAAHEFIPPPRGNPNFRKTGNDAKRHGK